jgi:ABC-type transport system involved in Fe-S cluster assembly fused permease/ATPase subunit
MPELSYQITRGIHTDCLLNYETVKYFNGEDHESKRYHESIRNYQALEYQVISGWHQRVFSLVLLTL